MAAYRFYDPAPVFFNMLGLEPRFNGKLQFYAIGTTTPKNTWSDENLTILNTNPVILDGSGRASTDIFLDGDYSVLITDNDGGNPITRDVISGAVSGQTIPPLVTGQFLSNDGSNLDWEPVRQLPDATGSTNQYPVTNGGGPNGYTLQNIPVFTNPLTISALSSGSVKMVNGANAVMLSWGTDTVAASGSPVAAKGFTFNGVTYTATPRVVATINGSAGVANPSGGIPSSAVNSISLTGAQFNIDTNAFGSTVNITQPVPFMWFAIGPVAP